MYRMMALYGMLLLAAFPPASADGKDGDGQSTKDAVTDSVMVMLQKRSKGIESCTATFETIVSVGTQRIETEGFGYFRLPNLMYITVEGGTEVSVSDGSYLWIVDAGENSVSRVNLGRVYEDTGVEADLHKFDPLRSFRAVVWESIRHVGVDSTDEAIQVFTAKPLPNLLTALLPTKIDHVELGVHDSDGLLRSVKMVDTEEKTVLEHRFVDIQRDKEVGAERFRFVVPAGFHPMDATPEMTQLLSLPD